MFNFLGRRFSGLRRILRIVSLFAAVAMWLTGRSRKTTQATRSSQRARSTETPGV